MISIFILSVLTLNAPAWSQSLVPLTDPVQDPLLPPAISNDSADFSGQYLYIWQEGPSQVLQFLGDFRLSSGSRELQSKDAVVWMTPRDSGDVPGYYFEIFLWHDVVIRDPGGVLTEAPVLFVTLQSSAEINVYADTKAFHDNHGSLLYQDARRVRDMQGSLRSKTTGGAFVPSPLTSFEFPARPAGAEDRWVIETSDPIKSQPYEGGLMHLVLGRCYFARGDGGGQDFIEGHADAAVIFRKSPDDDSEDPKGESESGDMGLGLKDITGIYLEGDVRFVRGHELVRAQRLYYDAVHNRALILDPVMRLYVSGRDVPIYVRAEEARQLSSAEYLAHRAKITTSEFYTPHFHLGASELYFVSETDASDLEGVVGVRSGLYEMSHVTFNVGNVPVLYWPWASGNFREGEGVLRTVRIGTDSNFGFSLETTWRLFPFFGLQTPEGFDRSDLDIDYYTDRGLGAGVDTEYTFEKSYGLFRGYFIYDMEDADSLGPYRDDAIEHPSRGRATWRHRQFLDRDWSFTLEGSYYSDANFLEEYFEKEFDNDKEQETRFQLKKQRDNWAWQLDSQIRTMNWLTQTERMPELSFRLIGEPVGPMTFFSENRAGLLRYRPDERRVFISARNTPDNKVRSGAVWRGDSRQELDWPIMLGPINLVPFVVGRASVWDDSPHEGGVDREFGMVGVRGSLYAWRVFDTVQSALWDLSGLRHIIKLDFAAWASAANRGSHQLFPFDDEVEGIDDFSGGTVGLRQRWQTRRGAPGLERIVDWITLDLRAGFFDNPQRDEFTNGYVSYARPEESVTSNYVAADFSWRLSDTTVLLSNINYDTDEGDLDIANVSVAVERSPRFSYFVGWRRIGAIESNLLGFGFNYRASQKHTFALRHYSDIERGQTEQLDFSYIRKFPRWYMSFTFALNEIEDNTSVSISLWPEGFPNIGLGSKRYTGIATSTAIRTD